MTWTADKITMIQRYEFSDGNNTTICHAEVTLGFGCYWLKNIWTDKDHRQQGLATMVVEAVVRQYQDELVFCSANPYTDCPMSREELTTWLAGFGFRLTRIPAVLARVPGALLFPQSPQSPEYEEGTM